ncbi:MAG TPA: serine hydrolase [Phycisphaerae bacterium]|nr:serine hydrolase [Phycisphaerae bacterium]
MSTPLQVLAVTYRNIILATVVATLLVAGVSRAQIITPRPTFSVRDFDQSLTSAVGPNVIGYQYVLIKDGQVVSQKAGGLAQNAADGNLAMTNSTPTSIGSLAKFLSGTAMLNLMEKPPGPGSWDYGLSLQQKLDRTFTTIVPDIWASGNTPGVEDITFRQLLQHRSGFDDAKVGNRTVLGFLKDPDGFLLSQYDAREYSNINFVMNGYLIPMYLAPSLQNSFDVTISANNLNQTDADSFVRNLSGNAMHAIMKTRIWDQMNPTILPNCDAANTLANTAAYGYTSKNDAANGFIMSLIDNQGHCGGHGGYYMSSIALAAYLAHFSATDLIVTSEGRNAMYNETMATNDRLVWSSSTPDPWLDANFDMPNVIWSNGIHGGNRGVIIRLPQNYYLVLLTNSPDLSVNQLRAAGVNAFIAGMD